MQIKIRKDVLIVFLLLFPIIKPVEEALAILVGPSLAHGYIRVLSFWDYISIAICFIWFFTKTMSKRIEIKMYTKILILISGVFIIATLREFEYDPVYICRILGNLLMLTFLANLYTGEKFIHFLRGCFYYLTLISVLNALTVYIYYPKMYATNYYLFGLDNMGFIIALHSFFVGIICNIVEKRKIGIVFLFEYSIIFGAYLYSRSGTAIMLSIATVVLILIYRTRIIDLLTYKRVLLIVLFVFVSITLIQNIGLLEGVSKLLGKGNSFNGRTIIWTAMWSVLPKHWIGGFGITPSVTQYYLALFPSGGWLKSVGHMHNIVFEFLFRGGVIGLGLFCSLWFFCIKNMEKNKQSLIYKILCAQVLLLMVACMFEFRVDTYTFWLLPFSLYEVSSLQCRIKRT